MNLLAFQKQIDPDSYIEEHCDEKFIANMSNRFSIDDAATAVATVSAIANQNNPKNIKRLNEILGMGSNVQHEYLVTAKDDAERDVIYKRCDRLAQSLALVKNAAVFYAGYEMNAASGKGLVKAIEIGFHAMGPHLKWQPAYRAQPLS